MTDLCECGCGERVKLSDRTDAMRGVVRGQPLKYVNGHSRRGRLRTRYQIQDCGYETPCWVWQLALNKETGYGYETAGGGWVLAHRAVYEQVRGPIPQGMQLDHLCRNRACVNPDHLEPVSNAENARRGAKAKLTREDIALIRASTATNADLGRQLGVWDSTISRIRSGKLWAGV